MSREKRTIRLSADALHRLEMARKDRNWTQADLAARSDVEQPIISAVLNGHKLFKEREARAVFHALELDTDSETPWLSRTEEGHKRAMVGQVIDLLEECLPMLPLLDFQEWALVNAITLSAKFPLPTPRQAAILHAFRTTATSSFSAPRRRASHGKGTTLVAPLSTTSDV